MKKYLDFINKNKYIIGIILIYLVFFVQMQNVFFYGDDYEVLYPVHNDRSFINILNFCLDKMGYFWNEWSGRIVGHFSVSFGLSLFGIHFFRILNPIMVFFMIFLSLKILNLFKKFDFNKFLFVASFLILGVNIYISRETLYWAYSSILYIWGFNLTLLVIYFVYKNYLLNKKINLFLFIFLMTISLMQTFILEQISFILISFLLLMLIVSIKNKKEYKYIIILLFLSIIGFLISGFAPGNILRTEPLVVELVGYNSIQIVLGKCYHFFNIIFNPKIYGFYFMILAIIVDKNYRDRIDRNSNLLRNLPSYILCSYFFLLIFDKLFYNIDIFKFYTDFDVLNIEKDKFIIVLLHIIYFVIYIINLIYMMFKTIKKENRFILLSFIVTFISTIIPIIFIRYIGTRYYLYFFLVIIILCINYITDLKKELFDIRSLVLMGIVLSTSYMLEIILILMSFILMFKNKINFEKQNFQNIVIGILLIHFIININITLNGYYKNSKIYKYNEQILLNASGNELITIKEIPFNDSLYSWHSVNLDFNGYNVYYGFYLNKFYSKYYGFNFNKVIVLDEDGSYNNREY